MVDWLDRPIRHGDPFVPVSPCRVVTGVEAWILRPASSGRGAWTRVPVHLTDEGGLAVPRPVPWYEFDDVHWELRDGYRLRIRIGDAPGIVTGQVQTVDGDFR
jgi:hypothetical protein